MSSSALIAIAVVVALFVVLKLVRKGGSKEEATPAPKAASTPAPAAAAAPAANGGVSDEVMAVIAAAVAQDSNEVIAAITAALAVMGYTADKIAVIRPRRSEKWIMEARLSGRRNG